MSAYNIRMYVYVPKFERLIYKHTGYKVDINNFNISLLNRGISFTNISVGDRVKADGVTVRISFSRILRNITSPVNYISDIEFHNVSIDLNSSGETSSQEASPGDRTFQNPFSSLRSQIKITADDISIKSGKEAIRISNTEIIAARDQILVSSVFIPFETPFYINGVMKAGANGDIFDTEFTIVSEGNIESIISVSGAVNISDLSLEQNINIEKLKTRHFEFTDLSGKLTKNEAGIQTTLSGDAGNLFFERDSSGVFLANADISLSKINKDAGGGLQAGFTYRNGEGRLELSLKNLSLYGISLGSFDVSGIRQTSGAYDIFCEYGKSGKIYITYYTSGEYDVRITFNGETVGSAYGNIRTGEVSVSIIDLPLSKLPIVEELSREMTGTLTVKGALNETSGLIDFSLTGLATSKIGKTDIFGTITRSADIYVLYFYKSDRSMVFNSVIKSGQILSTDFKFVNADISNVLRAFGYTGGGILGTASGRIKYEKDGTTEFDIKAYDGSLFNNKYKKFETKGDVNLSRINISNFYLTGEDEQVSAFADGLIGFTNVNPVSTLSLRLRKINIGGAVVDSDILLEGDLNSKNEVFAKVAGTSIKISGVSFNNLSSDAVIASNKLVFSNIKAENGLEGNFSCVSSKESWELSGGLNFKNTDIAGFYPDLEAFINAAVKISGTVSNPAADIALSVKKGKYSGIPFSFVSEVSYINGAWRVKHAELLSSRTKLSVKGKYAYQQAGRLSVSFENLNEEIINKFVGFRTPVEGEFSGEGTLFQYKNAKSRLKINVRSPKAYVKKIKFNDIKSNIEVYGSKISISSASARLSDSEIRADKGNFNIKSGKYDLSLFLVNAHLGPADVFGRIDIDGKMNKKKGGSTYSGRIAIKNFWINKYRLASFDFDYIIKNRRFTMLKDSGPVMLSGSLDFSENVKIEDFKVAKSSAVFSMDAFFRDKDFNFAADGNNMDLNFLSEILDLPVDAQGKTDFSISASGSFVSPEISFLLKSQKGSVMNIPYDNADIEIVSSGNKAEIKTVKIFKRNEINVEVKGYFPFWIDDSLTEKMGNMPVNVTYEADDSKMHILKYLSSGEIKPKSGRIHIEGAVRGTSKDIRNSGRLYVYNGVFDMKTYIDRMKDLNVDIIWDDNSVKINKFSGRSGSGRISLSGGLILDGFSIQSFDITAQTDNKGIPVRVPQLPIIDSMLSRGILQEYSSGEPRFNIRAEGTPEIPKISGWISLENTRFSFPPPVSDSESFLPDATEFNIELKAAKNTKFENSFADVWVNGSLFIRGTQAFPKPSGVIETRRGTIKYLGIVFDVINAKLEIIDEDTIFVSGEAETNVYSPGSSDPEVIILSISRSSIDNLNVRFYSRDDPTMDSQTALAKVTRTEQTVSGSPNNQELILGIISDFDLRQQALRLIDSSFATPLARNVLRRTGIADNFKVSYVNSEQQATTTSDPTFADLLYGTKYSVEKNITDQFLLGYSVTFDQIQRKLDLKHEVEMRYRLNNNLFLSGSYELESEDSLHEPDRRLMLQHQIRFGLPSNKRKGVRNGND